MNQQSPNVTATDGSRHFGALSQSLSWEQVRDHVSTLQGAELEGFLTDHVTEAWIDFSHRNYKFTINNQFGEYWFFVSDPNCPDEILLQVLAHFDQLLTPSNAEQFHL